MFIRNLVTFLFISLPLPIYAVNNIIDLAKETLKLNETANNYAAKKEVAEKFADIKEYIQTDFKNGNKLARVDVFLLLDGLIQNNLSSLQSFLATAKNTTLSQEFSQSINYEYAEKLSYAYKENKRLLTTEYRIENSVHQNKCINYVNGNKISNNYSFFAPAGLSYYIASYCDDNTFMVKKIQSETAQPNFEITLNEYGARDITSFSSFQDGAIASRKSNIEPTNKKKDSNAINQSGNIKLSENKKYLITTGLGYNYFSGILKNEKITNTGTNYGSILYSRSVFQFQNLFVAIDIAPIYRDIFLYQELSTVDDQGAKNTTHVQSVQSQKGFFLRPSLGINKLLFNLNQNISAALLSNVNITFVNTEGINSYSRNFLGLTISPTLNFNLEKNFNFEVGGCFGAIFPNSNAEFVTGAEVSLGYGF